MKVILNNLGIIRFKGEDAFKFANSQFSNSYLNLNQNEAKFSAFCTPQGRVIASLIGFKSNKNELLLIISRDLIDSTIKKLKIYLFRSKCEISDASNDYNIFGFIENKELDVPWQLKIKDNSFHVTLFSPKNFSLNLIVKPKDLATEEIQANDWKISNWNYFQVLSGVVTINNQISEKYIPHMLNYGLIGGLDFKKGCYPGQEVVARTEYKGGVKRRIFLIKSFQDLYAYDDILSDDEIVGEILQVAKNPNENEWLALACISIKNQNNDLKHNSKAIKLQKLAYELFEI